MNLCIKIIIIIYKVSPNLKSPRLDSSYCNIGLQVPLRTSSRNFKFRKLVSDIAGNPNAWRKSQSQQGLKYFLQCVPSPQRTKHLCVSLFSPTQVNFRCIFLAWTVMCYAVGSLVCLGGICSPLRPLVVLLRKTLWNGDCIDRRRLVSFYLLRVK